MRTTFEKWQRLDSDASLIIDKGNVLEARRPKVAYPTLSLMVGCKKKFTVDALELVNGLLFPLALF